MEFPDGKHEPPFREKGVTEATGLGRGEAWNRGPGGEGVQSQKVILSSWNGTESARVDVRLFWAVSTVLFC